MFQKKRSTGFSFIEIVIVITIIATLSAVAFFSYIQFSQKSRDTLRLSNVKEIQGGLEVYAIKMKKYPTPDASVEGNISYNGNSFAYSKVGFVKQDVASALNLKSIPLDPVYQKEIQYATLDNGKRYQLSTVLESMFSQNSPVTQKAYATSQIAKLEGNYNGRFIKVSSGSTHTVISLPSLFLNNGSGSLDITVNQPVQNILVSGAPGSIDILNNTSGDTFSYTPKVIYSSSKCGVETDQEIVDFLLNLRDAYNQDPFTGLDEFRDIFNDYESIGANGKSAQDIKMAMAEIDFSTLERIGSKINDALGCEIKSFKTTDIFPETCQNNGITESGDFEGYPNGFSMTGSCLFSVTMTHSGAGIAEVRNNIGTANSKGLLIKPYNASYNNITLSYTTFSYIPAKLSFDFKGYRNNINGSLTLKIDGLTYETWSKSNLPATYTKYSTELLPPGLHKIELITNTTYADAGDYYHFDNILFGCKRLGELSGETNCGRTLGFEDGPTAPWNIFTFSGTLSTPWPRFKTGTGLTQGDYAVKLPTLPASGIASISYQTEFTQTGYFSLDYTTRVYSSSLEFIVDGNIVSRNGIIDDSVLTDINSPRIFQTPPLPPGVHTITIKMSKGSNPGHASSLTLDNFKITYCNSYSQSGCGRTLGFEDGGNNPYERFSFGGSAPIIWHRSNYLSGITEGSSAIVAPILPAASTTYMTYKTSLSHEGYIKFDYINKMNSSNHTNIYINNQIVNTWYSGNNFPITYKSPILKAGSYEIKIEIYRNWNGGASGHYNTLEVDNFQDVLCTSPTVEGCGRDTLDFEDGNISPFDLFTFTGSVDYAWQRTSASGTTTQGIFAVKGPIVPSNTSAIMTMNKNFSQPQRFLFDIKTNLSSSADVRFYINNVEYALFKNNSASNTGYVTFSTPLLPVGNYEFKWSAYRPNTHTNEYTLDNFRYDCIGGGTGCGMLTDANGGSSFETGDTPLYSLFTFTGSTPLPWNISSSPTSNGQKALQMPNIPNASTAILIMNKTFSQPQKFHYDIKTNLSYTYPNVKFFINNVEYKQYINTDPSNTGYVTFSTPLLPVGSYEFKWEAYKASGHTNDLTLDNFRFDCIGGGTGCGILTDANGGSSFETGDVPLYSLFTFTGSAKTPWNIVKSPISNGFNALQTPNITNATSAILVMNKSLSQSKKIRFDIKTTLSYTYPYTKFYINNVEYKSYYHTDPSNSNYVTYTSALLPPGNYEFKWIAHRASSHTNITTLDNIQFVD